MSLSIEPAHDFDFDTLSTLMSDAFTDYIGGSIEVDRARLCEFVWKEQVNLNLSRIAVLGDTPVALAMIARKGWRSRIASYGVARAHARKGYGRDLLEDVVEDAIERQDRSLVLECFEQNDPAIALYKNEGFVVDRRLYGYRCNALPDKHLDELLAVDIPEVAHVVATDGLDNLPWQPDSATVNRFGPPMIGYKLGPAYAIISDPRQKQILIHSVIVQRDERRKGWGRKIVEAISAIHGQEGWVIPAICPEEMDSFFKSLGFVRDELNQVQMSKQLRG